MLQANKKGQQLHMSILIRGHSLPLRLIIPPLRTSQGFACSVASLSRCPYHYPPGHHSLRYTALMECPPGQGKPSTWPEGHDESEAKPIPEAFKDTKIRVREHFEQQVGLPWPIWAAIGPILALLGFILEYPGIILVPWEPI